ncbi:carbonic anhydrase [Streptomyces sp. NBC_00687]|uniref:carbonic anhydrase n=1 Tax=Streptomyces sp. NBC_00687 TaxID=2975807 RepID=UPI0022544E70|nr:carbonic anhydrase [Streptomyces sp. NBC_00687]MCX4920011.1 carbonic anhydrase [Streptomyces sp. NBC_00687]
MHALIEHARTFPDQISGRHEEFAKLAQGQKPQALFISCSDSRVVPSMFTGARPGDIFELRTAGNIVPPYRPQVPCAVAGTVEFAVQALHILDIVVCGHSHCGAVQGLMREQTVQTMPMLRHWLYRAGYRARGEGPWQVQGLSEDPAAVAQRHILTQLDHLRSYPWISRRLTSGRLRLHAWYYTVETGQVLSCPSDSTEFAAL